MSEIITFSPTTIEALKNATVDKFEAVATAAREAVDRDRKVTVRVFADSLRAVTVGLGMAQAVLAAAVKAAKDGADVESAMTDKAIEIAQKARVARAKANDSKARKDDVKALTSVEDTLFKLGGRDRSDLLVEIEGVKGEIATLTENLKKARDYLARLEARYIVEQGQAFKTA